MCNKKYMKYRSKLRKGLAVGMATAMMMALLAGCSDNSASDGAVKSNQSAATQLSVDEMQEAVDTAMETAGIDVSDMFTKRDLEGTYDESEAVKISLSGKSATCDSSDVQIQDGVVTIKAAGVYIISGTLTDGTIVIDAGDDDKVQLVLDGASATASDYAAIYAKNADKVFVTLADDTENSLTVSGEYEQTDDNNVDAVIFSKCDLTLNGSGSLTVKDTTGHGIVSKDDLRITGGTYTVDSQDHCLNGKDSVRIAAGTFDLTCDEDGIHAGNDDQQDGYIYIEGGDINISVGDDGMHAEGLLIITGGDIDISKSYEGIEGHKILVTGGNIDVVSSDDGFNAAGGSSSGDKNDNGTKDGGNDKAGGTPPARPGNGDSTDGNTDSDTPPARPGNSDSTDSKTGSNTPPARPGNGDSTDGNTDSNTPPAHSDNDDRSGGPGMGGFDMDSDSDAYIVVTGGVININADEDGIDSNGYLGISGGEIYVLGPSNNGNGALDYGIYGAITGGQIVAVGGSGMAQGFGDESGQCSALINFDEWLESGVTVSLKDSSGKELVSYNADKKFNSVVISTSDMKQGETYTLTAGDQSSTFTLDEMTYSEGSGGMVGPQSDEQQNGGDMKQPSDQQNGGDMKQPSDQQNGGDMKQPSDQQNGDDMKQSDDFQKGGNSIEI